MNSPKYLTAYGNVSGPGYQNVISWLSTTWTKMPRDILVDSFRLCGIGEREVMSYHTILRDILFQQKTPNMGEIIIEDNIIENDHLVDKDLLFIDECSEIKGLNLFKF